LKVTALALALAWMVLKIRFRTLKFLFKKLYLLWAERKKRRAFAKTCNDSGYAEKETEYQPSLHSREFRESFVKTVGQPHSFENLDPKSQKNRVSSSFCKIFLRLLCCRKRNVLIS